MDRFVAGLLAGVVFCLLGILVFDSLGGRSDVVLPVDSPTAADTPAEKNTYDMFLVLRPAHSPTAADTPAEKTEVGVPVPTHSHCVYHHRSSRPCL